MPMIKLESPVHGPLYIDPFFVIAVRNFRPWNKDPDITMIHLRNRHVAFEVLGTVDEVMDKLGLKHE